MNKYGKSQDLNCPVSEQRIFCSSEQSWQRQMETSTEILWCDITCSRFDYVKSLKYFQSVECSSYQREEEKKKGSSGCSFAPAETVLLLGSSQALSRFSTEDSEEMWPRGGRLYFLPDWCWHKATWAVPLQSFLAFVWSALVKLLDTSACETRSCAEISFEMKANTGRSAWSPDKVWGLPGTLVPM